MLAIVNRQTGHHISLADQSSCFLHHSERFLPFIGENSPFSVENLAQLISAA
jgi:hypothetical protein